MKITNQTLGWFILICINIGLVLNIYDYIFNPNSITNFSRELLITLSIMGFIIESVVILTKLFDDDIEFEINIPNPFTDIKESFQERRKYLKEYNEIHHLMARAASNEELDFLLRKKEIIENKLKL